jgi:prolyl oligopeptidase
MAVAQDRDMVYPVAHVDTVWNKYFETTVGDPYRSLEYDSLPATQQWIHSQAELSDKYLKRLKNKYNPERQLKLNSYHRFGTMIKSGKYYFDYIRETVGGNSNLYIKSKIDEWRYIGDKVVDAEKYKKKSDDKVKIKNFEVSEDNKYIAFALSYNGSDWHEIHVKTLYPFRNTEDVITQVKFSNIVWSGQGFFYTKYPFDGDILKSENKNAAIWYHELGNDQEKDKLVYDNKQFPTAKISFKKLKNSNYLIISERTKTKTGREKDKVITVNLNGGYPYVYDTLISSTSGDDFTVIGMYKNKFMVNTTLDAPHGKILLFDKNEKNKAEEFIAERGEIIDNADIIGNKVLVTYLKDVDYINITFDTSATPIHKISFPMGSSISGFNNNGNDSITIFYHYSFLYPPIVYQYNVNDFSIKLVEKTEIAYDYKELDVKKVFFNSADGTKIPMFIASKKGLKYDDETPTILYGYGGNGIVMTPFCDRGFISFMQNGGIVALPCLRGGGEYGAEWHNQGSVFNKQNVFDDFIGAAEYLFKEHYTNTDHLVLMGGSNGGLLVAAVANQRPDICRVVIAQKGVYDMLRYQKYTIGNAWEEEYGSSVDSLEFQNLIRYSPLHNIRKVAYPAMLIITADHDDRVVPMHSYKYTAALQHNTNSRHPILLYIESNNGHTDNDLLVDAYIYSFIYDELHVLPGKLHNLYY